MALIAPLPDGPWDIIGDVHGEYDALLSLLDRLGYDRDGHCASGRHLVFLGDLIDRGPDSPAVVERVKSWVADGKASCILGNHELLALVGRPLHGNGWIVRDNDVEGPGEFRSKHATDRQRADFLSFFDSLPIVLEHDRLRLVHACWHDASIRQLRQLDPDGTSPGALYRQFEAEVPRALQRLGLSDRVDAEIARHSPRLTDPDWAHCWLPAHARAEVRAQLVNPLRVLTSGLLEVADEAFYAMGQWRMANRARWWESYDDAVPVVIGHFWRRFDVATKRVSGVFGRDVFEGIGSHEWMGKCGNVYCVDYSVGQRHAERALGAGDEQFHGKLAALRFPECEVVHDDGSVVPLHRAGGRHQAK